MPYIGAKTKKDKVLITIKAYGTPEDIEKISTFSPISLSQTLDSIVEEFPTHAQNKITNMTEYVLDEFETTIYYDMVKWVEVETLHADGTFYGDVRVHDEALV